MTFTSLDHIEEGHRIIERLKSEGLDELAEGIFRAIRYSFSGLELVYSLLNSLESAKESGSIKNDHTVLKIDNLIVDLKKKVNIV